MPDKYRHYTAHFENKISLTYETDHFKVYL